MLLPGRNDIQNQWISKNSKIYLNWAAAERIRKDVVEAENKFRSLQQSYEDDPKGCMNSLRVAVELARSKLSLLLNSSHSNHIIFTTGSEESLKTIFFAHALVPWGSQVVATDCEFYGVYSKIMPPRYQLRVAEIWSAGSKPEIVNSIAAQVTTATRLLLLSHVCYNSGLRLPVREIINRCKAINPSLLVLVDGAQAVGQVSVNVSQLGCDFYAGDAHKWLLGPDQAGFLYVRDANHLQTLARDLSSIFSVCPELNHDKGSRSGAVAFELAALSETIDAFLENDYLSEICRHGALLAERFRDGVIKHLTGSFAVAPQIPQELKTNIVCLKSMIKSDPMAHIDNVHDELLQRGIHCAAIKCLPKEFENSIRIPPLLRFCFHYRNTAEEVDFTIKALSEINEFCRSDVSRRVASQSVS